MNKTLVIKFGGAAVASIEQFSSIADIVISRHQQYSRLIIVVSAMGETTNHLIDMAHQVHPNPPQREYDMLISAGERISMSLLAMALCKKNKQAISFTGSQSGILTCNNHANAKILDVRPHRLASCLDSGKIVIVAGFQGVSTDKEITTLGRGGSDTTAVALALALGAEKVEFFKDVPGVFNEDPKRSNNAQQFTELTYQQALEVVSNGARILHPRAIRLASKNRLLLQVRSFASNQQENPGTFIYDSTGLKPINPLFEE